MNAFEKELLQECRQIAETTMWNDEKPANLDDIITSEEREQAAQAYYQAALGQIPFVTEGKEDPGVILRGIRYLHGHAMPPIKDNTEWFGQSLQTLLQIVCPFSSSPPGGEPFFADLRRGMDKADAWASEQAAE